MPDRAADITTVVETLAGWRFDEVCDLVIALLHDRPDYRPVMALHVGETLSAQALRAAQAERAVVALNGG